MDRELDREIGVKIMGDKLPKREGMVYIPPCYSSDLNAAHEVEEKIKELGLIDEYIDVLVKTVGTDFTFYDGSDLLSYEGYFLIVHASASDRCKAALMAFENK